MSSSPINEKIFQNGNDSKCKHCKDIIKQFVSIDHSVHNINFFSKSPDEDIQGDIEFSITFQEMGIERETYLKYSNEIFSNFMIDFFGEFLVRENISKFVKVISSLNPNDYVSMISLKTHRRFGMKMRSNNIIFSFHISLFQDIITEDLKRIDW